MIIERLNRILKNDSIELDMYSNKDFNDCKSKYNSLIYMLYYLINEKFNNPGADIFFYKIEKILKYNKESILLYLNIIRSILVNQKMNEIVLNNIDLSFIKDLKGNLKMSTLDEKRIVINQIRNSFAHNNGKVFLYEKNNVKRVRIDNKKWFSIDTELNKLNDLFNRVIIKNNNGVQKYINELYLKIINNDYKKIPEETASILLVTLLMCYNKESLLDVFMSSQTAFIDASKFTIEHKGLNDDNAELKRNFLDKYKFMFNKEEDKESFKIEWENLVDSDSNEIKQKYYYIKDNMPYDITSNKHVPIPIFLRKLRNACSHGNIIINDSEIIFNDINEKTNSNLKYTMRINIDDFKNFLSSNYFYESILTSVNDHLIDHKNYFYMVENEEVSKSFANYMEAFKNRFPDLSIEETVIYMYKNNKFSSYLLENPEREEEFYNYKLYNNLTLWEFLNNIEQEKYIISNEDNKKNIVKNYILDSYYLLYNYASLITNDINEVQNTSNDSYKFFKNLYLFYKNIYSTGINKKDIKEEELESINKLKSNWVFASLLHTNYKNIIYYFFAVGLQTKGTCELNKILLTSYFNHSAFNKIKNKVNDNNLLSKIYENKFDYNPKEILDSNVFDDYMRKMLTWTIRIVLFLDYDYCRERRFNKTEFNSKNLSYEDLILIAIVTTHYDYFKLLKDNIEISDDDILSISELSKSFNPDLKVLKKIK